MMKACLTPDAERRLKPAPLLLSLWLALTVTAQRGTGELRLQIVDATGAALAATVELRSQVAAVERSYTAENGRLAIPDLPFGPYLLEVRQARFSSYREVIGVYGEAPVVRQITLNVAPVETVVTVSDAGTLLDTQRSAAAVHLGAAELGAGRASAPGRSLLELVQAQPGWLLEANGVLHPRGSEYNVQYVIDGIPLLDNRSPAFAPLADADDLQSATVYTAGYPAEYGRKLGGIIEGVSRRPERQGWSGAATWQAGSHDRREGSAAADHWNGRTLAGVSLHGAGTSRFLDPPVQQNYTNRATLAGIAGRFERESAGGDRWRVNVHRRQVAFQVPSELTQFAAGQRQDRNSQETLGQLSWQRLISGKALAAVRVMARDTSANFWSNTLSTPIIAGQQRGWREAYLQASLGGNRGRHDWKAGAEAIFAGVREDFAYRITDPDYFDDDFPPRLEFSERGRAREQSWFVQDAIRWREVTASVGLRWDRYALAVEDTAWSPRVGLAWSLPQLGLVLRASYDRAFETPASEGILVASSPLMQRLTKESSGLPLRPSRGDFYQAGFSKAWGGRLRLDAAWFRRRVRNFADDSLLLNTGISFPISFASADIRGYEARLEAPRWGPVTAALSYSNLTGTGYLPLSGGLFLEEEAAEQVTAAGSFPITQDQRHTAHAQVRVQLAPRLWMAAASRYGSGLPVEREGDFDDDDLVERYGARVVSRVNFARGRVRPSWSADLSAGADLWKRERFTGRVQVEVINVTDRLNVVNFSGAFSGSALGASRTLTVRWHVGF